MSVSHIRVLFVCLGNICRSPTAEAVFSHRVYEQGLHDTITTDSAGTSDWHIGSKPDPRTISAGKGRGYDLQHLRGRQVSVQDFHDFDYILAMDQTNLRDLEALQPTNSRAKLSLFLHYSSQTDYDEVPDPYHGGDAGFQLVIDLIEDASQGLLNELYAS